MVLLTEVFPVVVVHTVALLKAFLQMEIHTAKHRMVKVEWFHVPKVIHTVIHPPLVLHLILHLRAKMRRPMSMNMDLKKTVIVTVTHIDTGMDVVMGLVAEGEEEEVDGVDVSVLK